MSFFDAFRPSQTIKTLHSNTTHVGTGRCATVPGEFFEDDPEFETDTSKPQRSLAFNKLYGYDDAVKEHKSNMSSSFVSPYVRFSEAVDYVPSAPAEEFLLSQAFLKKHTQRNNTLENKASGLCSSSTNNLCSNEFQKDNHLKKSAEKKRPHDSQELHKFESMQSVISRAPTIFSDFDRDQAVDYSNDDKLPCRASTSKIQTIAGNNYNTSSHEAFKTFKTHKKNLFNENVFDSNENRNSDNFHEGIIPSEFNLFRSSYSQQPHQSDCNFKKSYFAQKNSEADNEKTCFFDSREKLVENSQIFDDPVPHKHANIILSKASAQDPHGRPVTEIPQKYRYLFNFSHFNTIQTMAFDDVLYTDKSLVIGAPTGSGKTVIFELAILRLIFLKEIKQLADFKAVYMAPIKAIVSERFKDWKSKFSALELSCCELTGDSDIEDYFELSCVHIILTTPEKWDFMTRRWKQNRSFMRQVKLFLIDEVHTIGDNMRGATLEAVINRMKTVSKFERLFHHDQGHDAPDAAKSLRFVAVSATIPNIEDIAEWLGDEESSAIYHKMNDRQRPVPLKKVVIGYAKQNSSSAFKFDLTLNYKLPSVLELYSEMKPAIVFCSTRKGTIQAAQTLSKEMKFSFKHEDLQWLRNISRNFHDSKLSEMVVLGIAFHHAGLTAEDRKLVEELFSEGRIAVLLSTSTLAMGVNLPAHLVVIKSTQHYVMGEYLEYSESQVLQMIGRAGRPQFDTSSTAVIMTQNETKWKYESLLNGTQLVESSLHLHLIEHLNAEIVLETITDVSVALKWIESSFLYVRIHKNPKHYGIEVNRSSESVNKKLQELCFTNLNKLASLGLIQMDEDCFSLRSSSSGQLMAKYCVAFDTVKNFFELTGHETLEELLRVFCSCEEFKDLTLRVSEKKILNELNKHKNKITARFPFKDKIKTCQMKVSCLIQAQLGCLPLQEFGLQQDTNKIFRCAPRIARCLVEMLWSKPHFELLHNVILLSKCLKAKLWENSKFVAKQLPGIGFVMATSLVNNGITSFDLLLKTNPRNLELMINRQPPFGSTLSELVKRLPQYNLQLHQLNPGMTNEAEVLVSIQMANASEVVKNPTCGVGHTCVLLIGTSANVIICKMKIRDSLLISQNNNTWTIKIIVKQNSGGDKVTAHFISQDWVGLDVSYTFQPAFKEKPAHLLSTVVRKSSVKQRKTSTRPANKTSATPRNEYERCLEKIKQCGDKIPISPTFKRLKTSLPSTLVTPQISDFSYKKNSCYSNPVLKNNFMPPTQKPVNNISERNKQQKGNVSIPTSFELKNSTQDLKRRNAQFSNISRKTSQLSQLPFNSSVVSSSRSIIPSHSSVAPLHGSVNPSQWKKRNSTAEENYQDDFYRSSPTETDSFLVASLDQALLESEQLKNCTDKGDTWNQDEDDAANFDLIDEASFFDDDDDDDCGEHEYNEENYGDDNDYIGSDDDW